MKYTMKALTASLLVVPTVAAAHTGGEVAYSSSHFLAGVAHALTGIDHVFGAVLAGVVATLAVRKEDKSLASALPLAFLAVIAFVMSAMLGYFMPAAFVGITELAVLGSLAVMMAVIATGLKHYGRPLALATTLVAALASCHALAHGAELASTSLVNVTSFATGACLLLAAVASLSAMASKQVLARFKLAKY